MGPWLCILGALPPLRCPGFPSPPCLPLGALPKGAAAAGNVPAADPSPAGSRTTSLLLLGPVTCRPPSLELLPRGLFLRSSVPRPHAGGPPRREGGDARRASPGSAQWRRCRARLRSGSPSRYPGERGEERRGEAAAPRTRSPLEDPHRRPVPKTPHRPLGTVGTGDTAPCCCSVTRVVTPSWYPEGLRTLLGALPGRLGWQEQGWIECWECGGGSAGIPAPR